MTPKENIVIGILTLPFNANYGGVLQTYALQTFLKNSGFKTYHIYRKFPEKNKLWYFIKSLVKFFIGRTIKVWIQQHYIKKFFNKQVTPKTGSIRTNSDFKKLAKYNFTTIIVGSDQVWRKECIYGDLKYNYFLDFVDSITNKISFSASFGIDYWQYNIEETQKINQLISEFKAVSVREKSSVEMLERELGISALHHLDPVFLLENEDYYKFCKINDDTNTRGLIYILDESEVKRNIIKEVSSTLSIDFIKANYDKKLFGLTSKTTINDWLSGFSNAKYIITDSFHGCAFSILFNKPFLAIGNTNRGLARFQSLLGEFGLLNRLIDVKELSFSEILDEKIDWNSINKIIHEKMNKIKEYLIDSIK